MPLNKGRKFGREIVRAIADPLDGQIVTNQWIAAGPNQYRNLADVEGALSVGIEGVSVKALIVSQGGSVSIVGPGRDALAVPAEAFPLSAGETVDLHVDDLAKVIIFIPTTGDGVAYIAIAQAVD